MTEHALATTEVIIPEGYDPDGPNASRLNYARALAAEAQKLFSATERFVVVFATIRDQQLYQLLGYASIRDFAFKEYGVSHSTAQRWVVQGRAISEIDEGESTNGLVEWGVPSKHSGNPAPLERVTDDARLSQREAARLAKAEKDARQSEVDRKANEAREVAQIARKSRELEALGDEPDKAVVATSHMMPPRTPERLNRVSARDTLNRLMAVIEAVDDVRVVVNAATATEKSVISAFAAHFSVRRVVSEEVRSEKDCVPHPVARRLGKDCGRCGGRGVWK